MPGQIYVGIAGWSYKDWEDVVYPATLKGAERLAYLSQFFDLVCCQTLQRDDIWKNTFPTTCRFRCRRKPMKVVP